MGDVWLTGLHVYIWVVVNEAFVRFAGFKDDVWGCEGCGDVSKGL